MPIRPDFRRILFRIAIRPVGHLCAPPWARPRAAALRDRLSRQYRRAKALRRHRHRIAFRGRQPARRFSAWRFHRRRSVHRPHLCAAKELLRQGLRRARVDGASGLQQDRGRAGCRRNPGRYRAQAWRYLHCYGGAAILEPCRKRALPHLEMRRDRNDQYARGRDLLRDRRDGHRLRLLASGPRCGHRRHGRRVSARQRGKGEGAGQERRPDAIGACRAVPTGLPTGPRSGADHGTRAPRSGGAGTPRCGCRAGASARRAGGRNVKVRGRPMRTIWPAPDGHTVEIIDQTKLPHELVIVGLSTLEDAVRAIRTMQVRGAPLIGATAAYGVALAIADDPSDAGLAAAVAALSATRPTAVNLRWALAEMERVLRALPENRRVAAALAQAGEIAEADVLINRAIGQHGEGLIAEARRRKHTGGRIDVLTHCNAGWLATVDWGTALAPIYRAHDDGIAVHVWVDETRPRNQGAGLTAWELAEHGVPHTVIVDNAAGHVMREGLVDLCIVGTDRTTAGGDVANKIGTYTKALAARDNGIPFYVALPSPTIDWEIESGAAIPIERRDSREVTHIEGWSDDGRRVAVRLTPQDSPAANYAFDVTPARLVTGLITERGVCAASRAGLLELFPEHQD